ncbi:hypothetical protein KK083_02405 [Fulvivirgaceae bacterium PWU4]|uniref:Uncharacterized protein n=1 Tax=Chryseosolibacter histidini TaxID=2782349 RepID=A0AAP2DGE2_9BACT|nr:hypothetical protein [Chryseosolibacter histidini]MBT1695711.1 hypothetical protein [Chryseosolibacter histidini]
MKFYLIVILCLIIPFRYKTFAHPDLYTQAPHGKADLKQPQRSGHSDSIGMPVALSSDQVLLEYVKVLKEDTEKHRLYVEEYYDRFFYTVTALVTVAGGILVFFGVRTLKETQSRFEELFARQSKTRLEKLWNEKSGAMDKKIDEFITEVQNKFVQLNIELNEKRSRDEAQSEEIAELNVAVVGLKKMSTLRVKKSYTLLEYEAPDGNRVMYVTTQEVVCTSDEPVREIVEKIKVDEPGIVELIHWNQSDNIDPQIQMEKSKCEVKLLFKNPLMRTDPPFEKVIKARLKNAFSKVHESWTISPSYVSDEELLELRLPAARHCKEISVEKVDYDGAEKIYCKISKLNDGGNHNRYLIHLPSGEITSRYVIHWVFEEPIT